MRSTISFLLEEGKQREQKKKEREEIDEDLMVTNRKRKR
jgi:hypothetical protein